MGVFWAKRAINLSRVSFPISFKCQLCLHHWQIRYLHGGLKTSPESKNESAHAQG